MAPILRPLGTTGMAFTTVGLGMAGPSAGSGELEAALRRALELGVNWIDTAPFYGGGDSERRTGRVLASLPEGERPYVVTKCGLLWEDPNTGEPAGEEGLRHLDAVSVCRELEDSLQRLGLDRVDLYLAHWPPEQPPTPLEEYWQTLVDLRSEGKVRAIGLSNHKRPALEAAEAIGHVDAIEPCFSALRRMLSEELAWCEANGTGAIAYMALHDGLLTGTWSPERVASLPADDYRRDDPDFTTRLASNLEVAEAVRSVAERHGVSCAAAALAWAVAWPGVLAAIAGARTPAQVENWAAALELELSAEDVEEVSAAIERSGAGFGPARP